MKEYKKLFIITIIIVFSVFSLISCSSNKSDLGKLKDEIDNLDEQKADKQILYNLIAQIEYLDELLLQGNYDAKSPEYDDYEINSQTEKISKVMLFGVYTELKITTISFLQSATKYSKNEISESEFKEKVNELKKEYKKKRPECINKMQEFIKLAKDGLDESDIDKLKD